LWFYFFLYLIDVAYLLVVFSLCHCLNMSKLW
jgi:hypothetical protein